MDDKRRPAANRAGLRRAATRALCVALAFCFMLGGCSGFDGSGDELFALPRTAGTILALQSAIDEAMEGGGEYSAPVGGINRQSVQMSDLNGDGTEEAILFLRMPETLKICVYEQDSEGNYSLFAEAEGEGVNFDSVGYADLTGGGTLDLLVGRSLGSGVPKALSVLSLGPDGFSQLLSATYSGCTQLDMDSDGRLELIIARQDLELSSGVVEVYRYSAADGVMLLDGNAELSRDISSLRRLRTGYLTDGVPAVFVTAAMNSGEMLTDVCAYRDGTLANITLDPELGRSREVVPNYDVNAADINGDGVFDLPMPVLLATYEGRNSNEVFRKTIWRDYSLDGSSAEVLQTFHNQADGWYFVLPETWYDAQIAADRPSGVTGERTITFSVLNPDTGEPVPLLRLFTLTGDNRVSRSELPGRFTILNSQTRTVASTIYAAQLLDLTGTAFERYALTEEQVTDAFRLTQTEWITGELTN